MITNISNNLPVFSSFEQGIEDQDGNPQLIKMLSSH